MACLQFWLLSGISRTWILVEFPLFPQWVSLVDSILLMLLQLVAGGIKCIRCGSTGKGLLEACLASSLLPSALFPLLTLHPFPLINDSYEYDYICWVSLSPSSKLPNLGVFMGTPNTAQLSISDKKNPNNFFHVKFRKFIFYQLTHTYYILHDNYVTTPPTVEKNNCLILKLYFVLQLKGHVRALKQS